MMKNNIFSFATSELSQDAMICWVCNNFNTEEKNSKLYNLAMDVIKSFLIDRNVEINHIKIFRQIYRIDVLIVVNDKYAIIIEDKIESHEHDEQIAKYKQKLIVNDRKYNLPIFNEKDIITVFLKTRYWFPEDLVVKKDVSINGHSWYELLNKYRCDNLIFTDYLEYLNQKLTEMDCIEKYYKEDMVEEVLGSHHGQHLFIKDLFNEDKVYNKGNNQDGTPWTNNTIMHLKDDYVIFCRIDKNSKGYYVSIRLYNNQIKKLDDIE